MRDLKKQNLKPRPRIDLQIILQNGMIELDHFQSLNSRQDLPPDPETEMFQHCDASGGTIPENDGASAVFHLPFRQPGTVRQLLRSEGVEDQKIGRFGRFPVFRLKKLDGENLRNEFRASSRKEDPGERLRIQGEIADIVLGKEIGISSAGDRQTHLASTGTELFPGDERKDRFHASPCGNGTFGFSRLRAVQTE